MGLWPRLRSLEKGHKGQIGLAFWWLTMPPPNGGWCGILLTSGREGERTLYLNYRSEREMMGYKYQDIQKFGGALNIALSKATEQEREGLLKIWDFFEGLLAEGYVEGEEVEV